MYVTHKGRKGDPGRPGPPCECDTTELNYLKRRVVALESING